MRKLFVGIVFLFAFLCLIGFPNVNAESTTCVSTSTSTLTTTTIQTTVYCNSYVSPTLYVTWNYVSTTTKLYTSSSSVSTTLSSTYQTSKLTTNAAQSITTTITIMSCSSTTSTTLTTTCTSVCETVDTDITQTIATQVITILKETNRLISSREFYYSRDVSMTGTEIVTIIRYTASCTTTCTSGRTTKSITSITSTTSCVSTTEIYLRTTTLSSTVCITNSSNVKTTLLFTNDSSTCYTLSSSRTFFSSKTSLTSTMTNNTTSLTTTTIFNVIKQIEYSSLSLSVDGDKVVILTDILDRTDCLSANQNVTVCVFTTSSATTSTTTGTCTTIKLTTLHETYSSNSTTTCTSSSTSVTTCTTTTSTESTMCTSTTCTSSSTTTTLTSVTTTAITISISTTTSSTDSTTSTTSTSTTAEGITFIAYEIIRFTEVMDEYEIIEVFATKIQDVSLDIYRDITIRKGLEISTSTSSTTSKITSYYVYSTVLTTTASTTFSTSSSTSIYFTVVTNVSLTTSGSDTFTLWTTTSTTSTVYSTSLTTSISTSISISTGLSTVSISSTLSTSTFTTDGTIHRIRIIKVEQTVSAYELMDRKYINKVIASVDNVLSVKIIKNVPSLVQSFRNKGYEEILPGGDPNYWDIVSGGPSVVHDIVHSGLSAVLFQSYDAHEQYFTYDSTSDITSFGVWCYIPSTYPWENLFEITTNNVALQLDLSAEAKDVWFYLDLSGYTTLIGTEITMVEFSVVYSPSGAWEVSPIYLDDWTLIFTPNPPAMTTTVTDAFGLTNQRKAFNSSGLSWVFYTNGVDLVYTVSSNNMVWNDTVLVKTGVTSGEDFSIWHDGTYVYYAYGILENINPLPSYLSFRSGTTNADGTITWNGAEEQISVDPVDLGHNGFGAQYPYITVDTSGYVYVAYLDNLSVYVIKSTNSDGTWGLTPYAYPFLVSAQALSWKPTVIPLTGDKVLVTYADDGTVRARYLNSTTTVSSNSTGVWTSPDIDAWTGSPTYDSGFVYVPSNDGYLYKYNAVTGVEIWNFLSPETNIMNTPAVSGGFVYVGENGGDGSMWCINATTGTSEWQYVVNDDVQTKPVFANGYVYFGANDWWFYCLDATTGNIIWAFEAWNQISGNPVIYDDDVIFGSASAVYRVDGLLGTQVWNCTDGSIFNNYMYSNIILDGQYVYTVNNSADTVVKINAVTGGLVWDEFVSGVGFGYSPFIYNDALYVGSYAHVLYCLNLDDGSLYWTSANMGADLFNPSAYAGVVYVGSVDNKVYTFLASTGDSIASFSTGGDVWSTPTFSATQVFITSKDGKVYSFNQVSITPPEIGVETATTNGIYDFETIYSIVAQGDNAHLVFMSDDNTIVYYKYTFANAGGSFGAETVLQTSTGLTVVYPTITIDGSNYLFVYWAGYPTAGHIYGKQYNTTMWSYITDVQTVAVLTNNKLTSFYESHSPVGVAWMTLNVAPYTIVLKNLYFAFSLNEPVTVSLVITDMDTVNNIYSMRKYYTFVGVVSTLANPCDVTDVWVSVQQGAGPTIFKVWGTTLTTVPQWFIDTGDAVIDLDSANCVWSVVGATGTATFKVRTEWDFVDDSNLDMYLEGQNLDGDSGIILMQTDYFDVISTLVATMTTGTPNVALNTPVAITGLVTYPTAVGGLVSSGFYPPDAQFTGVLVYEAAVLIVTDNAIVNGVYDVTFTPGLVLMAHTYHLHLDMTADFVDGHPANDPTLVITVTNDIPGLWAGILWWLDKIFLFFGVGPYVDPGGTYDGVGPTQMIVNWVAGMASWFIKSVIMMINAVTMLGSIILYGGMFLMEWGIKVADTVIDITQIVTGILDGTYAGFGYAWGSVTGLGDVWTLFGGANLVNIMPIFIIVWWMMSLDDRVKTTGQNHFAIAIGDIQTAFGLISIFTWFAMTVYSTIFGIVQWVFGLIGGILS